MSATPESVRVLLTSQDFGDRLRGLTQIRQLDPAIAFDLVAAAITDVHPRVRYAAVSQMANLGQQNLPLASQLLRERLQDSEIDVQAAAADSIGALGLKESFEALQQLYQHSSEWLLQFSILAALGALGDLRGFDLLKQALDAENELMQIVAIGSLGELGDPRAVDLLLPFTTHADWQIRFRAVQALRNFQTPVVQAALADLTHDPIDQVAQEARLGLDRA